MSMWTHIVAAIDFDAFDFSDNLAESIIKRLENAPKITGSEGNAEIFVNQLGGYNHWIGIDCSKCEYNSTKHFDDNGDEWCDADEDFKCPSGEYQTRVVITVLGDLRDRTKSKTEAEWNEFVKYIENMSGDIRNITCNIEG